MFNPSLEFAESRSTMGTILYGNSEHVAQAWRKIDLKKKIKFATAVDQKNA